MSLPLGRVSTLRFLALGFLALAVGGCGEPVREDRTITFSAEGKAVGFQHGDQGVFVADKQGGGLTKVFQPEADVIATSTPLWAPGGRRLIFTTARSAGGEPAAPGLAVLRGAEPNPAGELFVQFPIVYTCWLRDESVDEHPVKLFEARCDHAGYVAANLAVRWHPRGDRILYIDAVSGGNLALFAYDLQTKATRQIFPHNAQALIFDWTPAGTHLACVLGQAAGSPDRTGLWIGAPDRDDWWHVPGSESLAQAELPALLEQLRATRPAWTDDGARFAFVTSRPGKAENSPAQSLLNVGSLAERAVAVEAEDAARLQDLVWAPDGQRLGLVRSATAPALHVWSRAAGLSGSLDARPVRRFAGWCAGGDHMAYVVPDEISGAAGPLWSFLLIPDPLARDAVVIADGAGQGSGRPVFAGLRVTFPHWSPADETLSVWCTFSPCFRSLLSRFLSSGLRPGDPAAVLDARTGSLSWLTVNPQEEEQVGHYLLLKRAYAEALARYERAGDAADPPEPATSTQWLAQFASPRGLPVFQFHGLTKLGRHEEARARLAGFRKSYPPPFPSEPGATNMSPAGLLVDQPWFRAALVPGGLIARLLQDLSIAEVFLSLDAGEDGRAYFRTLVDSTAAESDPARLSAAVVLSQLLLIDGRFDEYAALATETLSPFFLKTRAHLTAPPSLAPAPPQDALATFDLRQRGPEAVVGLALLPLMAPSFLAGLSDDRLMEMVPRWEALRAQAEDDATRTGIDLVLNASYLQLDWEPEHQETALRLRKNPEISGAEATQGVTDATLQSLRVILTGTALGASWGAPRVP